MKVLIIGGMGVIGGAITEAAVKKGHSVTVLSRRAAFGKWKSISAEFIQGDWRDDSFAKKAVEKGFDVIVDTQIFDEKQMERSVGIINNHCKQFIYISTDSVYAHPSENLSEDEEIRLEDIKWDYGINKRKAELFLLSQRSKYSFNWSVIRPTITFGETRIPVGFSSKRGTYTLIDRVEKGKPILRFDDAKTRHALCHVSIFGNAAVGLFLNEKSYGRFYHISDDCSYTYGEMFEAIESIVGKKGVYVFADVNMLKKYNTYVYEEMIYDKNPEFTLDNTNIKNVCPQENFHVNLCEVLRLILTNLSEQQEEDSDYNFLTDLILLKSKRSFRNQKDCQKVSKYLEGLPEEYLEEVRRYGVNAYKKNSIYRIKKVLRPIKHFIIK